jgi:multiple sugar transport system permease protein
MDTRLRFKLQKYSKFVLAHVVVGLSAFLTILPFIWMALSSVKIDKEIFLYPPKILPSVFTFDHYQEIARRINLIRPMLNSVIVALSISVSNIFFCSLAGYAFAKIRFWKRDAIFTMLLATMMIPLQITMIPSFLLLKNLHLLNNFLGLIIPSSAGVFGIFMVRQFVKGIPDDLIEAATIDGCGHFRIYWLIILPLLRPVLTTLGIFTFIGVWNDFIWPLIVMTKKDMYTLPVALAMLNGEHGSDWGLLMAGAVLVTAPVLIIFFFAQKNYITAISTTGLKE